MNFVQPWWLAAIPPVLIGITILYFLKLKRREVAISSTYLWRQAIRDLRVNSPFQKLRMNLLLFLQLLIATLILVALARPRSAVGALGGRTLVLLIDRSASMGATDGGGPTRLARAVEEAQRLVEDMSDDDRALVIAFDERPQIAASLTNDKRRLATALAELEVVEAGTVFNEALELAFSLSRGRDEDRPRVIHLFSDGVARELGRVLTEEERTRGAIPETRGELRAKLPDGVSLRFIKVGAEARNLGIASVDLRRTLDRDALLQLFVGVSNYTGSPERVALDVYLDGALVESREVELEPDEVTSVIMDSEALRAGRIEVALDVDDGLKLDNRGYAIAQPKEALAALLVTDGNRFLENALEKMPFVRARTVESAGFNAADPDLAAFDVIIFDRVSPTIMPPAGCIFIDALPPFERLKWGDVLPEPSVVDWSQTHPVSAYVNFAQLAPVSCKRLKLGPSDEVLVQSDKGPLIGVIREGGRDSVVLTFDTLQSRWPFQAGFPIFFANALRWLGGAGMESRQLRPGEQALINVGEGAEEVRIRDPSGEVTAIEVGEGERLVAYSKTRKQGFYETEVVRDGQVVRRQDFAVNIADPLESALRPREEFTLPGSKAPVRSSTEVQESNQEVWRLVAWAALAFLLVEWWIYNRRVYV